MRLDKLFSDSKGVFMAHVYFGDPNLDFSLKQIQTLCDNGVDIIEFGIPFSDPTADGKVFQGACHRALKAGMTPKLAIENIRKIRDMGLEQPIVVTSYYNPILSMGVDSFINGIKEAGADALIVPNVPLEESAPILEAGRKYGIHIIYLVAPTTPDDRLASILKEASGFVYIINIMGVTGARENLSDQTIKLVNRVRKYTDIPMLAGFGISKREHAHSVLEAGADGAIVGSAIASIYQKNLNNPYSAIPEIASLCKEIKQGCIDGYARCQEVK